MGKNLIIPSSGEAAEQRELLHTAGGNAKWSSYSGKQLCRFLKVKHIPPQKIQQSHSCVLTQEKWKFVFTPKPLHGASLVAQWLRIHLPMQGTWVQALVWEDPTYRRATKPMHHNYWACALEPVSHNYWACVPQLLKPVCLEPVLRNKRSHRNEKPTHCNEE